MTGMVPFENDNSRVEEMKKDWLKEWVFIDQLLYCQSVPELLDPYKVVGYSMVIPSKDFLLPVPNKFGILPASLLIKFPRLFLISLQLGAPMSGGNDS